MSFSDALFIFPFDLDLAHSIRVGKEVLTYVARAQAMYYHFMRHWPLHRSIYVELNHEVNHGKASSLSVRQVLEAMFKSRADATVKTYMPVIKKFMDWCKK